jgi:hypothetical protein
MLEFLNEQDDSGAQNQNDIPNDTNTSNENDISNEQTASDKMQSEENVQKDSRSESYDFVSAKDSKKSVKRSTIVLVTLFAIGLAVLFVMIKKGGPRLMSAQTMDPQQAQIDALVSKLGGVRTEMSNKMDTIVKKFYEFTDVKQVSLDQLSKNPFIYDKIVTKAPTANNKNKVHARKAGEFKLFSIMKDDADTSKSCCMINDKLLSAGQTILEYTVKEIAAGYVVLEYGEDKIILKLVED